MKTARKSPAGAQISARSDMVRRVSLLHVEAMESTLPAKGERTVRQWLSRQALDLDTDEGLKLATIAMALAVQLESFTPSHTGATAVDRLARRRRLDADEQAAHRVLASARFTVVTVEAALGDDLFSARDRTAERHLVLFHERLTPEVFGVPVAAWIAALDERASAVVNLALPLDAEGLAVAMDFVRPGRGIPHGHRCAAAVYRHAIRHGGGPHIPGLNPVADALDDIEEEDHGPSPFDVMVADLLRADEWRDPPSSVVAEARALASVDGILECLYKAVSTPAVGSAEPGTVYRRFAEAMIEALHLRAAAGSGVERAPLDALAAVIDREVTATGFPRAAADLYHEIREALSAAKPGKAGDDLVRIIERIRALRAKTVDQGCTEEEALAAADKVAELLDRYGLSLGETDIRRQACLGVGIDSTRKRTGPIDECVPAIALFCDCRAWNERTPAGTIRSMFFGLPADVEAAQYLFERVATALDTETASFRKGELYAGLAGGGRQKATTSFQLGLSRGISDKLDARKRDRDTKTFQLTGRDLVPVKADVVEEELARLGMSFTTRAANRGRMILLGAYEAGQVASGRFEIQSEIERARG